MLNYASPNRVGFYLITAAIWLEGIAVFSPSRANAQLSSGGCHTRQKVGPRLATEFDIGMNGRLLLVPVRSADEECEFVVDTGASLTLLDHSLRRKLMSAVGRVEH